MASIISAGTTSGTSLNLSGDTSGVLQLASNGSTTAVTIDTSQNVGIGRTPDQRFQIAAPSAVQSDMFVGSTRTLTFYADATQTIVAAPTAIPMAFRTNDTERMRITSAGEMLVGTNTQVGSGKTVIAYDSNTYVGIAINQTNASTAGTMIAFRLIDVEKGSIYQNTSTVSYLTTSDYRLKENVAPMTGALAKVVQLKPCTYTWKIDGSDGQGFIAHELQAVVPDAVSGEKDAVETYTDEDGNEQTRIKPQGVDTSFLVATLTAAIQELKAELDATKAEVQALKGTL